MADGPDQEPVIEDDGENALRDLARGAKTDRILDALDAFDRRERILSQVRHTLVIASVGLVTCGSLFLLYRVATERPRTLLAAFQRAWRERGHRWS